ncbi:hypothetical protein IWQ60_004854 [Tieghemiomyces parasiticus]|uniref:Kinetochore protein Sos7 coiled-coil domain-containing protein n=1 Tax=Tieghemiomyces parasiticus TaxID=78921 RepID=A0A9W8AAM4_9FUNG|nr:hypothetical protein IWQ60_004854 [Tieghemiomyces parasiticus]
MDTEIQHKVAETARLRDAFQKDAFHILQLEETCLKKARNVERFNHPGTHTPKAVEADLAYYRTLFSKLKFNYLEQTTKERFLRDLMQEPPVDIELEDIQEIEAGNLVSKKELKKRKTETQVRHEQIDYTINSVADGYHQVKSEFEEVAPILAEIAELESQLHELEGDDTSNQVTIHDTLRGDIDTCRDETARLQRTAEDLEDELKRLATQQKSEEAFAAEAVRQALTKDPQVQELYDWFTEAQNVLATLFGVRLLKATGPDSVQIIYDYTEKDDKYATLDLTFTESPTFAITEAK